MIEIATDNEFSEKAALEEFTALRAEALQAFSAEWSIVALQVTATGVLFSFALTGHSRIGFLLIVPLVSYVLSGRYMRNDRIFLLIGRYIRTDLSPRFKDRFQWEKWYADRDKKQGKLTRALLSFAYGPAVFPGISFVALAWVGLYLLFAKHISAAVPIWVLVIVWALDLALTVISIYTIVATLTSIGYEPPEQDVQAGTQT